MTHGLKRWRVPPLVLAAFVMLLTAAPAQAETPWGCRAKIERAVARYEAAVDRFGPDSPRADKEHFKVIAIREKCYQKFGRWWDPPSRRGHRENW